MTLKREITYDGIASIIGFLIVLATGIYFIASMRADQLNDEKTLNRHEVSIANLNATQQTEALSIQTLKTILDYKRNVSSIDPPYESNGEEANTKPAMGR